MRDTQLPDFEILDCTVRDGGYINNWRFEKKLVREIYRALSKSGVDYVEIGYKGTEKHFDKEKYGSWRFSPEEDIHEVVSNIDGAKLAIMADFGKIEPEDFLQASDSVIELVRVAVHKDKLKDAIDVLEKIKEKGYKVSLNAMGYTNYSQDERRYLIDLLKKAQHLDYIYIADSFGSLFPDQIKPIFEPLLTIPDIKVGFHPHNNLQMAFANTLVAIKTGVHIIDCTVYGMGRAAGNLPTESIISFLEHAKKDKYNSIPILNIIDRYFVLLQNENKWGYQLPYMLSGMFTCHPDYAKALVDFKEYTIEDIWKALEYIKKCDSIGFSKKIFDKLVTEGVIGGIGKNEESSQKGSYKTDLQTTTYSPVVSYINRHKNRDFLILQMALL